MQLGANTCTHPMQADLVSDLIIELGKEDVVCVITDSAEVNSSVCICDYGKCSASSKYLNADLRHHAWLQVLAI